MNDSRASGAWPDSTQSSGEGRANNFIKIRLTNGAVALVDAEDAWLAGYTWTFHAPRGHAYAVHHAGPDEGVIGLHRAVLGLLRGDRRHVDHINGNGLDNRKANLRIATASENIRNQRKLKRTSSEFKGAALCNGSWMATIHVAGRQVYLGRYKTAREAALAYDAAARKHFGEFACLNFPREGERGCLPGARP